MYRGVPIVIKIGKDLVVCRSAMIHDLKFTPFTNGILLLLIF